MNWTQTNPKSSKKATSLPQVNHSLELQLSLSTKANELMAKEFISRHVDWNEVASFRMNMNNKHTWKYAHLTFYDVSLPKKLEVKFNSLTFMGFGVEANIKGSSQQQSKIVFYQYPIDNDKRYLTYKHVYEKFGECGLINKVHIPEHKRPRVPKGYAFIHFKSEEGAKRCLEVFKDLEEVLPFQKFENDFVNELHEEPKVSPFLLQIPKDAKETATSQPLSKSKQNHVDQNSFECGKAEKVVIHMSPVV